MYSTQQIKRYLDIHRDMILFIINLLGIKGLGIRKE
jgi:hypothetical protein